MVDSASFGEWIRRRRRALDLTREMLARQVGCAVVTIRKIETDERRPSRQVAERLAECLRIPADLQAAFLQVARGELAVDRMPVPVLSAEPASMMQAISSAYEGFEHLPLSSVAEQHSASVPTPPSVLSRRKLPEPISSFVGRAEEIIEICHHLSQARLLTLIGVGGIGKTRLAIEVARRAEAEYSGGAVWVDLAGLTDAQLVPQAVATALSVSEVPGRSPIETLIETIRAQKVFILLDNCEHLIEACAVLVMTLLQSCSQLRLFVTSREPLNLIGEITVAVSPLELPMLSDGSAGDLPRELEIGLDRLATSSETAAQNVEASALKLFVERASAVLPAFKLMQADVSAITQICQRLEGLPLAIELAAARVSVMNVQQIAARLNSSFDLLTGGNRAGLPRHRSLQATIDWSYALLSEEEQRFFRQLSVFSGGFTLETVEAVYALASASAQPRGHTTTDVVELMSQLVNKSLIVSGMRYTAGQERFRLLEPVRQYAAARLSAAGETEWLEARHAAFFRSLAAESAPRLIGPQRSAALKQLEQEHDNIRAALGWCRAKAPIDPQARETGLEIGVNLLWFWYFGGYAREGYTAFESLLDGATVAVFQKLHANACRVAGLLAWRIGDYPAARILLEDSLRLGENCGDQVCAAFSLIILGVVGLFQGDITAALVCSEQAVVRMRALNDQWALALALYSGGQTS